MEQTTITDYVEDAKHFMRILNDPRIFHAVNITETDRTIWQRRLVENKTFQDMEAELQIPAHTARTYFRLTASRIKREIIEALDASRPLYEMRNVQLRLLAEIKELKEQIGALMHKYPGATIENDTDNRAKSIDPELLNMSLIKLGLSVRSLTCLKRAGMHTVGDLLCFDEDDLMKLRNFGQKCISEVQCCLGEIGLRLDGRGWYTAL